MRNQYANDGVIYGIGSLHVDVDSELPYRVSVEVKLIVLKGVEDLPAVSIIFSMS